MVKKTAASKPQSKKTSTRTAKKPVAKPAVKKKSSPVAATTKVDYYPNRMTVAISALAGTLIVLLALIAVLGSR